MNDKLPIANTSLMSWTQGTGYKTITIPSGVNIIGVWAECEISEGEATATTKISGVGVSLTTPSGEYDYHIVYVKVTPGELYSVYFDGQGDLARGGVLYSQAINNKTPTYDLTK